MITFKMLQAAKFVETYSEDRREVWARIYADVLELGERERAWFFRLCNARSET